MTQLTVCLAALALGSIAATAGAQDQLPLFDCHIHYSFDAVEAYPPQAAVELLDRAGIRRALVSSTPNEGTLKLYARAPERFVPFLRPYRKTHDIASFAAERQSWYRDAQTLAFLETELARGRYRGIGEFHVNGNEIDTPVMRGIADMAAQRDLWLMAHSDAAAIERLFAFNAKVKIIWAHTGMNEKPSEVRRLLDKYPALVGELSHRAGIAEGGGLSSQWRELFMRYPQRFVYGSDTWVTPRWPELPALAQAARAWLADLPREVAEGIAFRNAERLFPQ
jgi:amidohydrolase family protein